jgi:anaerobic selenocysteine-containing dehydrogenase
VIAHSYCRICPALCGITVTVDDVTRRVLEVSGDPDHALSQGFTCSKGRALAEDHNAPDRLTSSLRRRGDGWESISSTQAIAEVAAQLSEIRDQHGPRAVGVYVGTRGYEVLQLAGATAWLTGVGSPSLYSTYTIDQPGKDIARALHGSWPAGFQDFAHSDVVLFAGNNPVVSATASYVGLPVANPRRALRDSKRKGLKIVVLDPRETETAKLADIHLQPLPGEDPVVLAAMVHVILEERLYDEEFVAAHTSGVQELGTAVAPFSPAVAEARAGVPRDDLIAAARMFGRAQRGCAIGGTGINMAPHPVLSEYLLLCLNTLCGRYMRAGDKVANPGVLTQGRALREGARAPRSPWGKGPQPRVRGLSSLYNQFPAAALADEILTPGDGQLRALVVSGGNPLVALPDTAKVRQALNSLDLLVTLDVRLSQTARISDYVVGCKMSLERADATLASDLRFPQPFAQYAPALVPAPGDLIEEWEFFRGLARTMQTEWDLSQRVGMPVPLNITAGDHALDTITTDGLWDMFCGGSRIPLEEIRRTPSGVSPQLDELVVGPADPANDQRLELADRSMIDELAIVDGESAESQEFPFRLTSRRLSRFHNSWGQTLAEQRDRYGGNPLRMNPSDMAECGVDEGDLVEVISAHGRLVAQVNGEQELRSSVVSMSHCWGGIDPQADPLVEGACTNELVDNTAPISQVVGMPRQSAIPVRIAKIRRG